MPSSPPTKAWISGRDDGPCALEGQPQELAKVVEVPEAADGGRCRQVATTAYAGSWRTIASTNTAIASPWSGTTSILRSPRRRLLSSTADRPPSRLRDRADDPPIAVTVVPGLVSVVIEVTSLHPEHRGVSPVGRNDSSCAPSSTTRPPPAPRSDRRAGRWRSGARSAPCEPAVRSRNRSNTRPRPGHRARRSARRGRGRRAALDRVRARASAMRCHWPPDRSTPSKRATGVASPR